MKKYLLKEYGSWGVMTLAFLGGIWGGGGFRTQHILVFLAISLAINAKQAFTVWMRSADAAKKRALAIFLLQAVTAAVIFVAVFGRGLVSLLPYAIIPIVYLILLKFRGEHSLITEISGFCLLTLAALVAQVVSSGTPDIRLYIVVALFYVAGVLKVRIQFQKKMIHRVIMIGYVAVVFLVYWMLGISALLLLPLLDNVFFAVTLYKTKLSFTGWLEVTKGIVFIVLLAFLYPRGDSLIQGIQV